MTGANGSLLVSPELALVDPELAERARELLPERRALSFEQPAVRHFPKPRPAPVREQADERPAEPPPAAGAPPAARDRARPMRRRWILGIVAVAAAAIAALALASNRGTETEQGARQGATGERSATAAAPAARPGRRHAKNPAATRKRGASARSRGKTAAHPRATESKPKPARSTPPSRARPRPRATSSRRIFAWVTLPGVRSYDFELFRGGARVFTARTSRAALTLPAAWRYEGHQLRLAPGRYRWLVRPIIRSGRRVRFGRAIVSARLVVRR